MIQIAFAVTLIMTVLNTSGAVQQNDFVEVVSSPDLTCSGSDILYTSYRTTKINCGIACVNENNCTGYTYRKLDEKCVGCQGGESAVAFTEPGMKYFVMNRIWGRECSGDVLFGGGNLMCLDGVFVCKPGYSFQTSTWSCVGKCSSYGNTYQRYSGFRIQGYNAEQARGLTSEGCLTFCNSIPDCVSIDFNDDNDWPSWCHTQKVTAFDVPEMYGEAANMDHYNRNCE